MPRFILIDAHSGYIFGDTADLPSHTLTGEEFPVQQSGLTPVEAARWLDEAEVGEHGRTYTEVSRSELNGHTGYFVYRADINGSEAVPLVQDGQDRDTIEAVERDCEFVTAVLVEGGLDA